MCPRYSPLSRLASVVVLVGTIVSPSCSPERHVPRMEYAVTVDIEDGTVYRSSVSYPIALVIAQRRDASIAGEQWQAAVGQTVNIVVNDYDKTYDAITKRDGHVEVPLDGEPFDSEGDYSVTVQVLFDRPDGTTDAWHSPVTPVHVRTIKTLNADCAVMKEDTIVTVPVNGVIRLDEGERGLLAFTTYPAEAAGECSVEVSGDDDGNLRLTRRTGQDGTVSYDFEAEGEAEGEIRLTVSTLDGKTVYPFYFVIRKKAPEPNPGPEEGDDGEDKTDDDETAPTPVTFIVRPDTPAGFVGKDMAFTLTTLTYDKETTYDIQCYLTRDGEAAEVLEPFCSLTAQSLDAPISLTVGKEWLPADGDYTLTVCVGGPEQKTALSSVTFSVYSLSWQWTDVRSSEPVTFGWLWSDDKTSTFNLEVKTTCPQERISNAVLTCFDDNTFDIHPASGLSWIIRKPARGPHSFGLALRVDGEEYTWDIDAVFAERYTVRFTKEGNSVNAYHSGPGTAPSMDFSFEVLGLLKAVIPYTEAIESSAEHTTEPRYEYETIQAIGKEWELLAGHPYGKVNLYYGWISTAVNFAKAQLALIRPVRNKATRWVQKNGNWVIEHYTPDPHLKMYFYIYVNKDSETDIVNQYVDINYIYDDIEEFFKKHDTELWVIGD